MALTYVYEPFYYFTGWTRASGWFDGKTLPSWWDDDVTSQNGAIVQLDILAPVFFLDPDVIFPFTEPIKIEVFPGTFLDDDQFFVPLAIRALDTPDKLLRNEIIRVR